jgi:hypothetical protein
VIDAPLVHVVPTRARAVRRQRSAALACGAAIAALLVAVPMPATAVTVPTLYVDGLRGSDTNDGRSPASAFRTISHAADAIPRGSAAAGYRVVVQGYDDYVYRERAISPGWDRAGASGAPIKFQAAGYSTGGSGYVRPIVSGADPAPAPGEAWQPTSTPGLWRTPWTSVPFGHGQGLDTALFQDVTTWLWERSSLTDLRSAAVAGTGGYLHAAGWLYVAPVGAASTRPDDHAFDVVMRNAFYFKGENGTRYVEVRGFEVRHAANGIALKGGVDRSVVADNRLVGNLFMGVQVSGSDAGGVADPAARNTVARNVFVANTLQGIKIDRGTIDSTFCENDISASGLAGIKLQGAPPGYGNTLRTTGNTICDNDLHDNTFNPTGSVYANTSGITIANGARSNTIAGNRIHGNRVGVHVTQEGTGRLTLDGNRLTGNRIWDNSRYGIYFYDGMYRSGSGSMTSDHDLIWSNGTGVRVDRGSTGKVLKFDTIFRNGADGVKVGLSGGTYARVKLYRVLVTHNGGYGVRVTTGNRADVLYAGLGGNAVRSTTGNAVKTAVNTRGAGYLSTSSSSVDFLRIARSSYQYTAGPSGSAIGARW